MYADLQSIDHSSLHYIVCLQMKGAIAISVTTALTHHICTGLSFHPAQPQVHRHSCRSGAPPQHERGTSPSPAAATSATLILMVGHFKYTYKLDQQVSQGVR